VLRPPFLLQDLDDAGVLCAPTAFGKTVTAAAMIARRGVNTLVLVHRTELLKQWQERLQFLGVGKGVVGTIGGGKAKPTGKIDIAVMQSLSRQGEVNPLVENYGQVIVDECHHVGAVSFDAILKRTKAKYVLGLTATPIRRDGQQPIIFMQCGPIRTRRPSRPTHRTTWRCAAITLRASTLPPRPASRMCSGILPTTWPDRRPSPPKSCVPSAGPQGAGADRAHRTPRRHRPWIGRCRRRSCCTAGCRRSSAPPHCELDALPPEAPRVLLATGKLVGEGFDHPPLDTLVLAMPVSWKGTLQQYAGRLHREHASKTDVRIIDFVDTGHPALLRMWDKRQRGYRAMGYRGRQRDGKR
jgi:superfamily II DNA or RNA helicase